MSSAAIAACSVAAFSSDYLNLSIYINLHFINKNETKEPSDDEEGDTEHSKMPLYTITCDVAGQSDDPSEPMQGNQQTFV